MIATQGGMTGGYGLYLREGKPTFVYNYLGIDRYIVADQEALPAGKVKLLVDFAYDGKEGERGKGASVTISSNGKKVAEGKLPRTIPIQFSLAEGLDAGEDVGSAVDFTYKLPSCAGLVPLRARTWAPEDPGGVSACAGRHVFRPVEHRAGVLAQIEGVTGSRC